MSRPALEVADIFRGHGPAWRQTHAGHVSLDQLKVMSAIERCRTVALGGHVARCADCAYTTIAYNSCRNRHCPKCQSAAAKDWLADREAELLPVPYYHVVFTLPAAIADIAYQNKAILYDLLFPGRAVSSRGGLICQNGYAASSFECCPNISNRLFVNSVMTPKNSVGDLIDESLRPNSKAN